MSYRKARTQHDKIKHITYIQYIQQSWRKNKEKKKKVMYINQTTTAQLRKEMLLYKAVHMVGGVTSQIHINMHISCVIT